MRAKILSILKSDNACGYDIVSKLVNARKDVIDDVVKKEIASILENVEFNNITELVVDFYPHNVKPSFLNESLKTWRLLK